MCKMNVLFVFLIVKIFSTTVQMCQLFYGIFWREVDIISSWLRRLTASSSMSCLLWSLLEANVVISVKCMKHVMKLCKLGI